MSVIAIDRAPTSPTTKPQGFWRDFAQKLDVVTAYLARHAVSEQEFRGADADVKRCRELIAVASHADSASVRLHPVRIKVR
jgi:hypothetical protein